MNPPTPENVNVVLRGWIQPCEEPIKVVACKQELEALGVRVGPWDLNKEEFFNCAVPLSALAKLDPLWGRYIWGLQ